MPYPSRPRLTWRLPRQTLTLGDRTLLMGILNLTPDSFSDGGRFLPPSVALTHGLVLLDEGADILDLGAESTRPGSTPLTPADEQERLLPILRELRRLRPSALLSVDTYHASTATLALQAGADIINDVSGLTWDPALLPTLAKHASTPAEAPGIVLMHTRKTPSEWPSLPPLAPEAVLPLVRNGLQTILDLAQTAGIPPGSIVLDPGFGFGKRGDENLPLLTDLASLQQLSRPLLVGLSRKRFLGPPDSTANSDARLHTTLAAHTAAILGGAHILRVHDVPAARSAADLADRLLPAQAAPVPN